MAGFTREELADFRQAIEAVRDEKAWSQQDREKLLAGFGGESEAILRLLSMAERAVSEETVRKLAMHDLMLDKDTSDTECEDVWDEFIDGVRRDLRPAAARLAANGKG